MRGRAGRGVGLTFVLAMLLALVALSACTGRAAESPGITGASDVEKPTRSIPLTTVPRVRPVEATTPPSAEASVVVFWSPHPDDESLGMGQAIARYVRAGWTVYVGLLTDGEDSREYLGWYRAHPAWWRDLNGNGIKGDKEDFGLERQAEFERATARLGVPRKNLIFVDELTRGAKTEKQLDVVLAREMARLTREFQSAHPGALQVTTMKYVDGHLAGPGDYLPQSQHRIACEAVEASSRSLGFPARFYKVYVYYLPLDLRWAPVVERDVRSHPVKVAAMLDGYDRTKLPLHLGLGWHSVTALFQNALVDDREYVTLPSDFK